MMKALVTGATGQLGWDVMKELKRRHIECRGTGSRELDITNREAVMQYIQEYRPDAVIHCAAYTAVDKAEDEPEKCRDVNVNGTAYIAEACRTVNAKMVYISTDYVFGDNGDQPHEVDDPVHPLNVYGQTKWEGEEVVRRTLQKYFIVRISWVFGEHGNNFVKTMLRLGKERKEISIIADQFGAPTYTADLAPLLCDMIETTKYGTYHACNSGCCSWAEFAEEIFKVAHMDVKVIPIRTEDYPTKAMRPKNSRLHMSTRQNAGIRIMPLWQSAVQRYLAILIKGKWSMSMSQRRIGIVLSYVNIALHAVIGFLYVPILLFYIGKNGYGLYQLMGSLIAYLGVMDFGLTGAVIRFYSRYKALQDRKGMENILAVAMRLYGVVTLVMLLFGGIFYLCIDWAFARSLSGYELQDAKIIFLILLFNLAINLLGMTFYAVIMAEERFLFLKGMEFLLLILQPFTIILVLQQHPDAVAVVLVQTLLNMIVIAARIFYCFAYLDIRMRFYEWNWPMLHSLGKLALGLFAVSIADQIFIKSNQIILGAIGGTNAVAVYSLVFLLYINYMALANAISGVYLPHVTHLVTSRAPLFQISDLFITVGRGQYLILLLALTGFILFGKRFIVLWAGEDFLDAYSMALVVLVPLTIGLIQNIGLTILQAMNQYGFRAKTYFCMGICSVALSIVLGMAYGGIGCALATGLCLFVGNGIIINWYYWAVVGLDIWRFWWEIMKISCPGIVCAGLGWLGYRCVPPTGVMAFLGEIILYTVVYSGMMWMTVMTEKEKETVRGMFGWNKVLR